MPFYEMPVHHHIRLSKMDWVLLIAFLGVIAYEWSKL